MITSLNKKKEKRRKKGKREGKKIKMVFGSHRKICNYILCPWGKNMIFFPKGKEYRIFSPNSIYQKYA